MDTVDAAPEAYGHAIRVLAGCEDIHAIITLFVPPLGGDAEAVAGAIRDAAASLERPLPVLAVFMAADGGPAALGSDKVRIPAYGYPEEAARALGHAARYAEWRRTEPGVGAGVRRSPRRRGIRRPRGGSRAPRGGDRESSGYRGGGSGYRGGPSAYALAAVPAAATGAAATRWLDPGEIAALLGCYGIPMAPWRMAGTPDGAGAAAVELGGLVALKAVVPGLVRKVEAGAVVLALEGAAEVRDAAEAMRDRLVAAGHVLDGFLVQRMVADGHEMLVGVVHDRLFGPVIACGAGGAEVSRLRDVGVRITPLTDRDAAELVGSLDAHAELAEPVVGPRGDIAALEETLLRVSAMVEAHPEIVEMDLNPVIVLAAGTTVVDARVRIERVPG